MVDWRLTGSLEFPRQSFHEIQGLMSSLEFMLVINSVYAGSHCFKKHGTHCFKKHGTPAGQGMAGAKHDFELANVVKLIYEIACR